MISQALPKIWDSASLDANKPNLPELMRGLFVDPYGQPGNALEGLFGKVAEVMRMQGVAQENIKVGLIIFSVICSAQVGIPLAIVLRVGEDKAVADHLLTICLRLVSRSLFVELKALKIDDLYSAKDHFRNKVLVCRDMKGLKKVESELKNFVVDGEISIQISAKTKFGSQMVEFQVSGPVGFIGIETESDPCLFDHPAIIRLAVFESGCNQGMGGGETAVVPVAEFEMARIAQYVGSFSFRDVAFAHLVDLLDSIRGQKPVHQIYKSRFAVKLIDVLTILNNPDAPDFGRFITKQLNVNPEHVKTWMKKNGWHQKNRISEDENLKVGKVEYFIMVKLLDGMLPVKQHIPSLLRRELFEVVKGINFALLANAFIPASNTLQQLYTLSHNETYWAKSKYIYLNINKNRADIISEINIEKELVALSKIGLIERKKLRDHDGHGYYITTHSADRGITFPNIANLFGECDEGQMIEAVDPLTGIVELI